MELFDLSTINRRSHITIRNVQYPVLIDGYGEIPCLIMGIGSLYQRTLSKQFRHQFTLYTSDFYWIDDGQPVDIKNLTIESICQDVIAAAKQLKLNQYILLGHSVFGGLVMEVAKYQPPGLLGVIGIGATPGWDATIIAEKDAYFAAHASKRRQQRFAKLQADYAKLKKT